MFLKYILMNRQKEQTVAHESEKIRLSSLTWLRGGTLFIGGGLGIQRSSVKFWSNGGGSRLLNLKKVRRGSCLHFRLQQNNICTIANAFSAINGLKFPHFLEKHAYGPPPPALNALHVRVLKAPSLIWNVFCCPWFTTCAFPQSIQYQMFSHFDIGQNTLRTSWHMSHESFKIAVERVLLLDQNEKAILFCRKSRRLKDLRIVLLHKAHCWSSLFSPNFSHASVTR